MFLTPHKFLSRSSCKVELIGKHAVSTLYSFTFDFSHYNAVITRFVSIARENVSLAHSLPLLGQNPSGILLISVFKS